MLVVTTGVSAMAAMMFMGSCFLPVRYGVLRGRGPRGLVVRMIVFHRQDQ